MTYRCLDCGKKKSIAEVLKGVQPSCHKCGGKMVEVIAQFDIRRVKRPEENTTGQLRKYIIIAASVLGLCALLVFGREAWFKNSVMFSGSVWVIASTSFCLFKLIECSSSRSLGDTETAPLHTGVVSGATLGVLALAYFGLRGILYSAGKLVGTHWRGNLDVIAFIAAFHICVGVVWFICANSLKIARLNSALAKAQLVLYHSPYWDEYERLLEEEGTVDPEREKSEALPTAQTAQTSEQLKSSSTGVREFKVPMSVAEYLKQHPPTEAQKKAPWSMSFEEQMDLGKQPEVNAATAPTKRIMDCRRQPMAETKEQLKARMMMLAANSGDPDIRKMAFKECLRLKRESRKEK